MPPDTDLPKARVSLFPRLIRGVCFFVGGAAFAALLLHGARHDPVQPGGDAPPPFVSPSAPANTVEVNGHKVTAEPGAGIEINVEHTHTGGPIQENTKRTATGTGAGLTTSTEGGTAGFNPAAPTASLGTDGTGGASGGGLEFTQTFTGHSEKSPLFWAGILALIGAAFCTWRGFMVPAPSMFRAAICLGVLGAGLIVASLMGAAFWIIAGVAALIAVGFLYESHKHAVAAQERDKKADALETSDSILSKIGRVSKGAGINLLGKGGLLDQHTTTNEDVHLAKALASGDV